MSGAFTGGLVVRATGTTADMVADADEVRRGLALFADPEFGCELMALKAGVHRTLPGSDLDGLCKAVAELPGGIGIYFRANPVTNGLGRPALNEHVVRRRWVYIDVDPVKADGFTDESATDAEKAATGPVADRVAGALNEQGWPAPVVVDSGNGCALYYACDLPNDDATRAAYKRLLGRLAESFNAPGAKIDTAVHNANRLVKVPGTWARKGAGKGDRPHRPCKLYVVPERIGAVPEDLFFAAAGCDETPTVVPFVAPVGAGTGREEAYGRAALENVIEEVANAPEGERNSTLYRGAARLGELAAAGVVDAGAAKAALEQAGAARDPDRGDVAETVGRGMTKGAKKPKGPPPMTPDPRPLIPNAGGKPEKHDAQANEWVVVIDGETVAEGSPAEFAAGSKLVTAATTNQTFEMHTLDGLMKVEFPEPRWVVPGLLSEGLNILAGKPKMGKSMLALNLAVTVAAGGLAMGNIQTDPGDVLYLSLEDRSRRIQSRSRKMLKGIGCAASPRLTIAAQWPRQGQGGLELIEWWMKRAAKPTLVIIDVWGKFRPPGNPKANAYSQDYEHMTPLKNLSDAYGCCVLALMHCRKGTSEDVVEDVSGTLGIAGAADGIIVLTRSRNDSEAQIFITGRDVADTELALKFDDKSLTWSNLGTVQQNKDGKLQQAVLDYLKKQQGARFVRDIADSVHAPKEPTDAQIESIRTVVKRLANENILRREGHAFSYPGDAIRSADSDGLDD